MLVKEFDYTLPPELIAQSPLAARDSSRLMLIDKERGLVGETLFSDIVSWLTPGDLLVVNDSRVLPAKLLGYKVPSGGAVEFLLLQEHALGQWSCLVRPGRRVVADTVVSCGNGALLARVIKRLERGERLVEFTWDNRRTFIELLSELGEMPLPHYIHEPLQDQERYQTVYSNQLGSVAAPTAGLHFTTNLMETIMQKGIEVAKLTLHVGLGTFRPVQVTEVTMHTMHSERYTLSEEAAKQINDAKRAGRRVIAVGTTSCRVLESVALEDGEVQAQSGETALFISPGYRFKTIDALITNFHLPMSTLLMLVASFIGQDEILSLYAYAVQQKYRFFSFGDAMFIADHVTKAIK